MRRFHLFELEDQKWCPGFIRDGITDFLRWWQDAGQIYHPLSPLFKRLLAERRPARIVDLCSGGGGPFVKLYSELENLNEDGPELCLTDIYPNRHACVHLEEKYPNRLKYHRQPVDATNVPDSLTGFRTLFTSFHHFPPKTARAIIGDAVKNRQEIGVFEYTHRSLVNIGMMLFSPFIVLFTTPLIRPFRLGRLFWTYILPVIPLAVTFDGIISCLRTYTPTELKDMADDVPGAASYHWEVGLEPAGIPFWKITYLIGYPMTKKAPTENPDNA